MLGGRKVRRNVDWVTAGALVVALLCGAASTNGGASGRGQRGAFLFEAIGRGDAHAVEALLEQGLPAGGTEGPFVLCWAAAHGHQRTAELALAGGVDPTRRTYGLTPLHLAAAHGQPSVVRMLLDHGAHVDATQHGTLETPLHKAVREGHLRCVEILIENGADVNARDESGATPLHCAVGLRDSREGRLLVIWEVLVRARGNVPECTQRWPGRGHVEAARLLLSAGAALEAKTEYGDTPLHVAVAAENPAMVSLLVEAGAQVDTVNRSGMTALHWAAFRGANRIARILLDSHADPNTKDKDGWDALHWATFVCDDDLAGSLLASGSQLDVFKAAGLGKVAELSAMLAADGGLLSAADAKLRMTPLHWAAWGGRLQGVEYLLSEGASTEARDLYGARPFHNAAVGGSTEVLDLLLAGGTRVDALDKYRNSALYYAAWAGQREAVEYLLSKGARMDVLGAGFTALRFAARGGNCAVVQLLLQRGAAVDSVLTYDGTTPLFSAVREGQSAATELLLKHGADANARNIREGQTVLHGATRLGCNKCVEALLAHGADPNALSEGGATPLHYAAASGRKEAARLLLEAGAQINARCNGMTPLGWAVSRDQGEVAVLLREHGALTGIELRRARGRKEDSAAPDEGG